jgi:tetratricopeptide (TPR) repeat protein
VSQRQADCSSLAQRSIRAALRGGCAVAAAALLLVPAVGAQQTAAIPTRPGLQAGADTNDAREYYAYGMRTIYDKPTEAMRGFYWASRIDPTSGEVLYGLQTATLFAMSSVDLANYYDFFAKHRKPEYLALDSLLFRAYTINPFLYPNFEHTLIRRRIEAQVLAENPGVNRAQLNDGILSYTNNTRFSANMAYADGRLPEALDRYAKDLTYKGWPKKEQAFVFGEIHATRARIFYVLGNLDSARAEMSAAVTAMRERDAKEIVILYRSKAMYEQSLGMIYEHQNRADSARDSYGQALQEDLSYYPAHSRLAQLQLARGDTAGALTELDLATQLQPNNVVVRYAYAVALVRVGRDAEAAAQLRVAIATDPYYVAPHLLLARIADVEEYTEDAVGEYQRFLALAKRSDPDLGFVKGRLTTLTATIASTPTKP